MGLLFLYILGMTFGSPATQFTRPNASAAGAHVTEAYLIRDAERHAYQDLNRERVRAAQRKVQIEIARKYRRLSSDEVRFLSTVLPAEKKTLNVSFHDAERLPQQSEKYGSVKPLALHMNILSVSHNHPIHYRVTRIYDSGSGALISMEVDAVDSTCPAAAPGGTTR